METSIRSDDFIPVALASLGLEADEIELAVMSAAHEMFWPAILELLALEVDEAPAERCPDLSQAPPAA